jgi:transposase
MGYLITAEQIAEITAAVTEGATRGKSLTANGVGEAIYRQIKRAAGDKNHPHSSLYKSFLKGLDKAEAQAEKTLVQTISASADWRAAAFLLERRWPDEWSQRIQLEVKKEVEHVLDVAERALPQEHFERFLEALSGGGAESLVKGAEQVTASNIH